MSNNEGDRDPASSPDDQAVRLAVAVSRLRSRLREEARASLHGVPISQFAILKRLRNEIVATAATLAAAEYVSQQAIAQTVSALRKKGLVDTGPDPADRRKSLIRLTDSGERLIESVVASRDAWLVRAIDATVPAEERAVLEKTIQLLERLADARTGPEMDMR